MSDRAEHILSHHDLKKTSTRMEVLKYFLSKTYALSHADIETAMIDQFDRVTLYRTLNTFEDKGITHRLLDPEGVARYALCADKCDEHDHKDDHIHFYCGSI